MMQNHHHHNHLHHHHQNQQQQQQQTRVFNELTSLILSLLKSPSMVNLSPGEISSPSPAAVVMGRRRSQLPAITPAGFASLMLGISLALMLCGSVTFFIGFMLLPWVIGLVMVFYFVGFVTSVSVLGRAFLCYATASPSPSSPRKDISAWKFL